MKRLAIEHTWDGEPIADDERARIDVSCEGSQLEVLVDAPYHGDAPPEAPPGSTPQLWNYEVVELFIAGPGHTYLELEFGPHGHHLALWLEGVRLPTEVGLPVEYETQREGSRWRGRARLGSNTPLPPRPWRVNAYAIHGQGDHRRYLAHSPVPGPRPDFHQLGSFVPWLASTGSTSPHHPSVVIVD